MTPRTVGLLHPGAMGAAVGRALTASGHTVLWASEGRSEATAQRAARAGLTDAGSVADVVARSEVVFSICPPHAALDTARAAGAVRGAFVDANAIAPATAAEVGAVIEGAGGRFVDGSIIGPPPDEAGTTRLYLSGDGADEVAGLFAGTPLATIVLDGEPMAASAIKMAYAGWTKGAAALLLTMRAAARAHGVEDALVREWEQSIPSLPARVEQAERAAGEKGWRWVAEMQEIAATLDAAGLPAGFHEAAAEVFRRHSVPA